MADKVTVFALQATRFQRPDFKIGQVSDPDSPTKLRSDIGDAFVYVQKEQFTEVPSWVLETNTCKEAIKANRLKVYDKPPSEDRAEIELKSSIAEARLAATRKEAESENAGLTEEPAVPASGKRGRSAA